KVAIVTGSSQRKGTIFMRLTDEEKRILDGQQGGAAQMALAVLVDPGELFGAEELIKVAQVHIDATLYMVDAGLEFAERIAALGGEVGVPTSLNPSAIDLRQWEAYRVPPEILTKHKRLEAAYLKMRAMPTWTCAPYQNGIIPRFGQQIAWGESNAIAFANSIIGARTNRYADLMDICAAIIGKVPKFGLHLAENRKATILIRLKGISAQMFANGAIYPLLGYLLGEMAGDQVAAITGIPPDAKIDSLKGFCAAAASSGAVGLFHMVGITPEAQTLEMCLHQSKPQSVFDITPKLIKKAEDRLWTVKGDAVDLIVSGCPHYSPAEFIQLVKRIKGKKVHSALVFWAFTNRSVYAWIKNNGILKDLTDAGVMVFTDGCPLQYPKETWHFKAAMTDSAKFANYCFSQRGLDAAYGSLADCVETAVRGKICRRESLWRKK
ncbi:MAG: aconitase X catalytic domain-containing protein, partial [Desulfobacterales bacterium]|nr:aconitase X catalytic domain-containing protein [Desulfobacterales bacterium]